MMDEANKGNVNIILSKDLSRLGRNNGKVLSLIDSLRELDVRLILITEASGGLDLSDDDHDILGIKTWYNEMYIKDISRKIRTNLHSMQKKGKLYAGNYYGYNKIITNGEPKLVIDENIRPVIELIFKLYINGLGYIKICEELDKKGYPTPSEYIRQRLEKNGIIYKGPVSMFWKTCAIKRILNDDVYIGNLRTRKSEIKNIKGKRVDIPVEEQYVFENKHEPIISKEDFKLVKEINIKRNELHLRNTKVKYNYIFKNFMVCGDCNSAVVGVAIRRKIILKGYNCALYIKYGNKRCCNHRVEEDKVLFFLKEFLKEVKNTYEEYILNIKMEEKRDTLSNTIEQLRNDLKIAKNELALIVSQKIRDLMKEENDSYRLAIEQTYEEVELQKKKTISSLTKRIEAMESTNIASIERNIKSAIDIFNSIINDDIPKRKDLELILDKIIVNKDRTLSFKLKVDINKLIYH